jgi:hypothetical protein
MVKYRGPQPQRIARQFNAIGTEHGQPVTLRTYVSASTGTTSAYFAGGGTTRYYVERPITALFYAPSLGKVQDRQQQLAAGQVLVGRMVVSLSEAVGAQDEIIWRGTAFRVESDNTPTTFGDRVWYRAILTRGDATG